jgi:hypothetical protein
MKYSDFINKKLKANDMKLFMVVERALTKSQYSVQNYRIFLNS